MPIPDDDLLTPVERAARDARRARDRARRLAARERKVDGGVESLDRWLQDVIRGGVAALDARPHRFFVEAAQALGDAQLPGLRSRLLDLAEVPGTGPDWPQVMLAGLGRLALLADAWRRQEDLPEPLRTDLRTALGFPRRTERAVAHGDVVDGRWLVVGQQTEELELVHAERTWLLHGASGRPARVQRYARSAGAFGPALLPGTFLEASLAYFPSGLPLRAAVVDCAAEPAAARPEALRPLLASPDVDHALDRAAEQLGAVPWARWLPCGLRDVTPLRASDGRWWIRDGKGRGLPLARGPWWTLLAVSGGASVDLFGEWDGSRLRPLLVAGGGGLRRLDVGSL